MHATITTETAETVELHVTDRTDRTHELDITHEGEIDRHHSADESVDVAEMSADAAEPYRQVRRFGKYYLARKRGYETLSPYSETDRIAYPEQLAATALVLGSMSPDALASEFETIYLQRRSATAAEPAPIEPPSGSQQASCQRIEQDLYLRAEPDRLRTLLDVLVELEALGGLRQLMDMYPEKTDRRSELTGILREGVDGAGEQPYVSGTSPVRVYWQTDGGIQMTHGPVGTSPDGPIASRLQLPVGSKPVRSPAAFQRLVVDHLRCQLRDCYLGMGVAPPRDLQVRGPGIAAMTARFADGDNYQRYHDSEAVIDWTRLPPVPSF
jgi:hypothetical protein